MSISTDHPDQVQAVIFDLDGVLMNSEWLAYLVWKEYIAGLGVDLPESVFPGMVGLTAEATAAYLMKQTGLSFDITQSCAWVWQRTIQRLKTEIDPLPGAVELVQALAGRGLPLAIASNSPAHYIAASLDGLDLSSYFSVRSAVDQVPNGKPAPDLYLRAARLLGVSPIACLAVEDSRVGMQSAMQAGLRVIAVPAPHEDVMTFAGAWRVYPSLVAVCRDLDTLFGQPAPKA